MAIPNQNVFLVLIVVCAVAVVYALYLLNGLQTTVKAQATSISGLTTQVSNASLRQSVLSAVVDKNAPMAVSFDFYGGKWNGRDGEASLDGNVYTFTRAGKYQITLWGNITTNPTVQSAPATSNIVITKENAGGGGSNVANAYKQMYIGLSNSIGGNIKETIDVCPSGVQPFEAGDRIRITPSGTYEFFQLHIVRVA
jgi:hypothetical protein